MVHTSSVSRLAFSLSRSIPIKALSRSNASTMPRWPISTSPLIRLRPRPIVHNFSSSSFARNDAKATTASTSGPGTSGPSHPETTEFKAAAGSSKSQSLNLDALRNRLKERANAISATATLSFAELGGRLNKATGYEHIEALKHKVVEIEAAISAKRQASRDAKSDYEIAITRRSNSQREVNDLLQRKSTWSEEDVGRFTDLVKKDHLCEQEEARAKTQVTLTEAGVEAEFDELMRTILKRYHEEQVWSDKIRSASTYGSLLALGVNIVVFLLAIMVVEPWKRRRLAETFERRIEELSLETRAVVGQGMNNLAEHFEKQEQIFAELVGVSLHGQYLDSTRTGTTDSESRPAPTQSMQWTAKAARDRDLWIAGAAGVVGGGALTLLIGLLR